VSREVWLLFTLTEAALCFTPGPAVLLVPQLIDPRGSVPLQVVVLAVTSVVIEFLVLLAYGALVGRMTRLAARPRAATLANRVAGSMLIVAGVSTAAIRRD
jgi:homoserine/homoserine lactone efflux protein